jgi:hypothetical protein
MAKVKSRNEDYKKGKTPVSSLSKFAKIAGHDGMGEEPSLQGDRKFPVAGYVRWWDNGVEYILFGKADGKTPSTSLKELVDIAESCYR